jgi:hypothetical protein
LGAFFAIFFEETTFQIVQLNMWLQSDDIWYHLTL